MFFVIIRTSAGALTNLPLPGKVVSTDVGCGSSGQLNGNSPATPNAEFYYGGLYHSSRHSSRIKHSVLAIGSSHAKKNGIADLGLDGRLSEFMDRRCIDWINTRKSQEKITLVATRNYVPPKTAFYADWLLLESEAAFRDFLQIFPQYCLDTRLGKIRDEQDTLSADLDRRVKRRDFDLSRVGDEQQRKNLARRYLEPVHFIRTHSLRS